MWVFVLPFCSVFVCVQLASSNAFSLILESPISMMKEIHEGNHSFHYIDKRQAKHHHQLNVIYSTLWANLRQANTLKFLCSEFLPLIDHEHCSQFNCSMCSFQRNQVRKEPFCIIIQNKWLNCAGTWLDEKYIYKQSI